MFRRRALTVCLLLGIICWMNQRAVAMRPQNAAAQTGLKIVVIEGENAVNIIQQKTAVRPIIEVRDRNDLPVSGATVTFTLSGGQNASFAGGAQSFTASTNGAGRATVDALTPVRSGKIQINVRAEFNGQTATTSIAQTNFLTAVAAQAASGASGSSGGTAGAAGASSGGLSTTAIVGIAAGVAGGVGAAVGLSKSGSGGSGGTSGGGGGGTGGGGTNPGATNRPPAITSATATPNVVLQTTSVAFSAQASDPDNDALTYAWDFGDGTSSTQQNPTKTYQTAATFNARLTVSDGRGGTATSQTTVTVRSLTGDWLPVGVMYPSGFTGQDTYRLTQNGTALTGSWVSNFTGPGGTVTFTGTISGTVSPTAPQVSFTLTIPPQQLGVPNTWTQAFAMAPSGDLNTLTGTITSNFPPVLINQTGTGSLTRR